MLRRRPPAHVPAHNHTQQYAAASTRSRRWRRVVRSLFAAQASALAALLTLTPAEVSRAYEDYQRGTFGIPWDHQLDDATWVEQVKGMAKLMGR